MKFPFVRPEIPHPTEWTPFLDTVYQRRYFTNFGPTETAFARELAEKYGGEETDVTLACNATSALTASLIANDVNGLVAIPDFTFPATLTAVLAAGCEPVICEVDACTGEIDVNYLAHHPLVSQFKAIMPVRTYGFVRNVSHIVKLATKLKIPVIIDSAAALGGTTVSTAKNVTEVFSLHATKSFGIGEGGAIFHRANLKSRLVSALNFGLKSDRSFGMGLNGKMSEFQAAIGLAQIKHIERLVRERRKMADWYFKILSVWPALGYPTCPGPTSWTNFPVYLPTGLCAASIQDEAAQYGYQIRRYYYPTLSDGFTNLKYNSCNPIAKDLSARAICLPLYSDVTGDEKVIIHNIVKQIFGKHFDRYSHV